MPEELWPSFEQYSNNPQEYTEDKISKCIIYEMERQEEEMYENDTDWDIASTSPRSVLHQAERKERIPFLGFLEYGDGAVFVRLLKGDGDWMPNSKFYLI